jgi:hypothetical protein
MSRLTETLKVRIEPELLAALERQAQAEQRDLSQMVRVLLRSQMVLAGQIQAAASRD